MSCLIGCDNSKKYGSEDNADNSKTDIITNTNDETKTLPFAINEEIIKSIEWEESPTFQSGNYEMRV